MSRTVDKLEKKIQRDIVVALRKIKGVVVFPHTASPFNPTGHPDLYGSIYGYSFWGEVKRPGNEPTPIQQATLELLSEHAYYKNTFVWDNVEQAVKDIQALDDRLEEVL